MQVKMGFKRPFDEEEFQEFPLKHPKQIDFGNKLTSFTESYLCHDSTKKADISCEDGGPFHKFQLSDDSEHDSSCVVSDLPDNELDTSAPVSWVTSSTSLEDDGSGVSVCSALPPEVCPRRSLVQFKDAYSTLFYGSPARQVPIGPNHQAEVPVWDPQVVGKYSSCSEHVDARDGVLMGVCVLLKATSDSGVRAGHGRQVCLCPDQGSIRCVREHVKEAREWLRGTLGDEKFVELGFCDMGEEVSRKWTEEEEWLFHEIVYSNPISCGKNFWEHLFMGFPSRTKKEIISYYFNVFMLRRRAVQNRSSLLDIDSDDDEWQGSNGCLLRATPEDKDSPIEAFDNQYVQVNHEDDSFDDDGSNGDDGTNGDDDNDEVEDEDDDDNSDNDSDDDAGCGGGSTTENDRGRNLLLKAEFGAQLDDCCADLVLHEVESGRECIDAQNLSCLAFEGLTNIVESFGSADNMIDVQEGGGDKSDYKEGLHGNDGCSTDGLGPSFLLEPCDGKVWFGRYPMSPLKGVDLLSTGNMIEEIFGPCSESS